MKFNKMLKSLVHINKRSFTLNYRGTNILIILQLKFIARKKSEVLKIFLKRKEKNSKQTSTHLSLTFWENPIRRNFKLKWKQKLKHKDKQI